MSHPGRALIRLLALAVLLAAPPASSLEGLTPGGRAIVAEVVDGDTVVLDRDLDGSRQVRLVGLQAPKLPLGRTGFQAWPLSGESRAALEILALGRAITLHYGGARKDRYDRHLAHLVDDAGTWVQGEMLRLGMARVYSFADNRARVADMLAVEAEARAARRGIWDHPFYAMRTPETAERHLDSFQLVEGRVADAARAGGRIYLNFGADWRSDFTVSLDAAAARLFRSAGLDPLSLKGRVVRVRGWLRDFNGPLIEASHPEQLEVTDRP